MFNYPTDLIPTGPDGSLTRSDVINALRRYWDRHARWTGAYIDALITGTGNHEYIARRGAQNAHNLAELLNKFYRYQPSRTVEDILLERFKVSERVLTGIQTGDEALYREAKAEWFRLTDILVTLLASLNPYWNLTTLREMVRAHYAALENEMRARLSRRDPGELDFDEAQIIRQRIADYMARGINMQFAIPGECESEQSI